MVLRLLHGVMNLATGVCLSMSSFGRIDLWLQAKLDQATEGLKEATGLLEDAQLEEDKCRQAYQNLDQSLPSASDSYPADGSEPMSSHNESEALRTPPARPAKYALRCLNIILKCFRGIPGLHTEVASMILVCVLAMLIGVADLCTSDSIHIAEQILAH